MTTEYDWPVYNTKEEHPDYPLFLAECKRALDAADSEAKREAIRQSYRHGFWEWAGGRAIRAALADAEATEAAARKRGSK